MSRKLKSKEVRRSADDLLLLPHEFLDAYAELFHDALKDGGTGVGQSEEGGIGRRGYRSGWLVRDERALDRKKYVDKELRDLARRMKTKSKMTEGLSRCSCGTYLGGRAKFCSRCGRRASTGDAPAVDQRASG